MRDWLGGLWPFGKKKDEEEERWEKFYDAKMAALEHILGPMHDIVGHAVMPFHAGGHLDMYYFCEHLPGTVFATMELTEPGGKGPRPNRMGTYELAACTRLGMPPRNPEEPGDFDEEDEPSPFDIIERRLCRVLTCLARYSSEAVLQPGDTCEIPGDEDEEPHFVIFDEFDTRGIPFDIEQKRHGLLLCIEIHRSELDHARQSGSASLFDRLKEAGAYPYSDLDRAPVA